MGVGVFHRRVSLFRHKERGVPYFVINRRCLNGVLNFINYLENGDKNIKITNLTSNRALCNE